ncbi:MAG: porin [Nitrosomonadales bacterium]|nr:porin [Nitrosomonadales bacterium]
MKKLLTFVSAITAGAIGTAAAEVSVSGGGNFYYSTASGDTVEATQEDSMSVTGGSVVFSMSTETTNGITVSGSASITADTDDIAEYSSTAAAGGAATGMSSLVFGMDGMTITLGDINNAGSGTGEGGDVATFASTHAGHYAGTAAAAGANDSAMDGIADGTGINVSTSMGAAAIDVTFVSKVGSGRNSLLTSSKTTGYSSGYAINVGFDVAGASVNVAAGGSQAKATATDNNTATALEVSYPASDALTVTVGGSSGTIAAGDEDNMFITAAYAMDADTTLSIGYGSGDNTTSGTLDKQTATTVNVSRSLGGGVSVFAEYAAVANDNAGVGTSGSAMTVGTSVSF